MIIQRKKCLEKIRFEPERIRIEPEKIRIEPEKIRIEPESLEFRSWTWKKRDQM